MLWGKSIKTLSNRIDFVNVTILNMIENWLICLINLFENQLLRELEGWSRIIRRNLQLCLSSGNSSTATVYVRKLNLIDLHSSVNPPCPLQTHTHTSPPHPLCTLRTLHYVHYVRFSLIFGTFKIRAWLLLCWLNKLRHCSISLPPFWVDRL